MTDTWIRPVGEPKLNELLNDLVGTLQSYGWDWGVHGPLECVKAALESQQRMSVIVSGDVADTIRALEVRCEQLDRDLSHARTEWSRETKRANDWEQHAHAIAAMIPGGTE